MRSSTIFSGALAALAVLPSWQAAADVTLSGDLRAGVQYLNDAAAKALVGSTAGSQARVDGRVNIYLSGNEDLGGGNSTIWQVQSRAGIDGTGLDDGSFQGVNYGSGGQLGNQDTFIGLKGAWGMLRAGNNTSNFGDGKYDKSQVEGLDNNGGLFGGGAGANMVRYDLPNFGKLAASYQFWAGEDKKNGLNSNNNHGIRIDYGSADDPWSIGGGFTKRLDLKNSDGTLLGNRTIWTTTAGINFAEGATLGVEYQVNQTDPVNEASYKSKSLGLYGYYATGPWLLGLQYGQAKDEKLDAKLRETVVMAHYILSKRTKIYAEYLQKSPEKTSNQNLMVVGLASSF